MKITYEDETEMSNCYLNLVAENNMDILYIRKLLKDFENDFEGFKD